ncbi:MAG TPA: tRNA (adenosine(37)-N6)-threonylcarbamoyltransferase complex ATPase subunit type 1 TsaE [Acidimicrobiaceae bacterium]|nr:tRNA (adenosine(37)-N6)-threonylcarbamoyltransferase complex ATPase subunit type 1 TsaE [Acidimicrobiaceae bacterium]
MRCNTRSVEATLQLASSLAEVVVPGDVILLTGELGAGKTAFTQGFGRGLGVTEPITSPTFTLVHEYEGRIPIFHLDVYRLKHLDEALDLALPEMIDGDAVTVIEWGDVISTILPPQYLQISFHHGDSDDDRYIDFDLIGGGWVTRERALSACLTPWIEDQRC